MFATSSNTSWHHVWPDYDGILAAVCNAWNKLTLPAEIAGLRMNLTSDQNAIEEPIQLSLAKPPHAVILFGRMQIAAEGQSMTRSTILDRMCFAVQQYRIDQPDSYTFAIYGPDDFYELHDSFSAAFERKEKLGLLAAMKAISVPSKAMIDAGEIALKSGRVEHVWQAIISAIVAEYEASRADEENALVD